MSRVVGGKAGHGWAGKRTCWVLPAVANNFVKENTYCLGIYFVGNPQPAAAPPLSSEGLVESLPKLNQGRRQWTCTTSFTGMPHVPCMSREAWVFFFLAIQPSMVRTTVEAFSAGRRQTVWYVHVSQSERSSLLFPHIFVCGSCFWFCTPAFSCPPPAALLLHNSHTQLTCPHLLTHNLSTQNLSTHTLLTHNLSTHNLSTQNLLTRNLSTHNLSTHNLSTHNLLTHNLPTNNSTHTQLAHTQLYSHNSTPTVFCSHNLSSHNLLTHNSTHTQLYSHNLLTHNSTHTTLLPLLLVHTTSHHTTCHHTTCSHAHKSTHRPCRQLVITQLAHTQQLHNLLTHNSTHTQLYSHNLLTHNSTHTTLLPLLRGNIGLHFVWQAWHVWHWAGSGGAFGPEWPGWPPRLLAWQAWHFATSTFVSRGRRGTW